VVRILVIEDDQKLGSFLTRVFREDGYEPTLVSTLRDAAAELERAAPDLLVVDRMLPDGDGIDLCVRIRQEGSSTPIMMLTALGELTDRVAGLDAGADDYILKPFEIDELLARVRALLRRAAVPIRSAGPLRIDLRNRKIWCDEQPIDLTSREFDLLAHVFEAGGAALSRARLLASVWGTERDPGSNLVEVHLSRLRSKLGEAAWMIETVRGGGYRFRREAPP